MRRLSSLNLRQRVYWRLGRASGRVHGRGPLLVAIGDSHTDPRNGCTLPWQVWLRRVARQGYKTVNLGVSGETTGDMRRRIDETLSEGQPEIAVLFAGANDACRHVDPAETGANVTFIVEWLQGHGIHQIVLIGPGWVNLSQDPNGLNASLGEVRRVLQDVAERYDLTFVDLVRFLRDRIERGDDPDFASVPYRQSRSWHAGPYDSHFNAYGQRLVAEAFLSATDQLSRVAPSATPRRR
jgi:lysophospholipase L1-like esterase